jgi:hypothetical protein
MSETARRDIQIDVITEETQVNVAIVSEALEQVGISATLTPRLPRVVKFAELPP